jgi:FixJ family two-component response regulator
VIVIDDDVAVLNAITFAFESEGIRVRAYRSAEAMLADTLYRSAACLVVDEHLDGMSGLDLCADLRARGVDVPTILISTPTEPLQQRAAEAGIPLVEKPLLSDALLNAVHRVLDREKKRTT